MARLRVGLVGGGWMGVAHATGWQTNATRAEIVAVADVSTARAQDISQRFADGRAKAYADVTALAADDAVEAIDICLPHHLHADAIETAARAGKAILCEKPICLTVEEAERLGRLLGETGVLFMAAHNQLFQPSLVEGRRLMANGAIGRTFVIRSIESGRNRGFETGQAPVQMAAGDSSWAWRADPARMGGGEVLDTGWHGAYRLLALAGERPLAVSAVTARYAIAQVPEDTGLALVRFPSGVIGELVTSWATGFASGWQWEVGGELGMLAGSGTRLVHQLQGWAPLAERQFEPVHTYTAEITHFLDVVQRGAPNPATFTDAATVLNLIRAIYQSAEERREVAVPLAPAGPGQ